MRGAPVNSAGRITERKTASRRCAILALVAFLAIAATAAPANTGAANGGSLAVPAKKKKKKKRDVPLGHYSGVTAQGTALSFAVLKNSKPTACESRAFGTTRCVGSFTFTVTANCSGGPRSFATTLRYLAPARGNTFEFRAIPFPDGWYELNVSGRLARAGTASGTMRVFGSDPEHEPGGSCESGDVSWSAHRG